VSVVVVSTASSAELDAAIAALLPQCSAAFAELIVVRAASTTDAVDVQDSRPGVRFVTALAATPVRELRRIGMAEAGGDIVAFTEDTGTVPPDWVKSRLDSLRTLARDDARPVDPAAGVPPGPERAG